MTKRSRLILLFVSVLLIILIMGVGITRRLERSQRDISVSQISQKTEMALKIYITESGIYEVTIDDLKAAGYYEASADFSGLKLFTGGHEQSLWIEGDAANQTIRFYGASGQSLYTRENVYWLVRTNGLDEAGDGGIWVQESEATPVRTPENSNISPSFLPQNSYWDTYHLEQNERYFPQVDEGDHWFWTSMSAPQSEEYSIVLSGLADGPAGLRLAIWGSTEAILSPDHHLVVTINGQQVADESWDGKGRHVIETSIAPGILREGVNDVIIEAPGDTGVVADIYYLDWLEVDYARFLNAEDDRLDFINPGGAIQFTGFSGPVTIYDVSDPDKTIPQSQEEGAGSQASVNFQGEVGHRYQVIGPEGAMQPVRLVSAVTDPDLRDAANGADYIAVGPPDLLEALQPLLDLRAAQGLKVMAVQLDAVYDQFNFGLPEPEAIRDFMQYTVESWRFAPQYLLLVGDATYDPKGYLAPPEANRVPTFLITTVFGGETASDVAFGQVNDDPWPDLAVGRIPARDPNQVSILVDKILSYEKAPEQLENRQPGQPRVIAIADGQEEYFKVEAQAFLDLFGDNYQGELYAPEAGVTDANRQIKEYLDQDNLLVAYFGHGSVNMWGKDRLFSTEDVSSLSNVDRLPVVLNMTCLTGLFTHPMVESLAEALLWQSNGGAIAVLAPTSLTLPSDQSFLSQALVRAILDDPGGTIGQILLVARRQVPIDSQGTRDVMQTYLLFGDPALHLASQSP